MRAYVCVYVRSVMLMLARVCRILFLPLASPVAIMMRSACIIPLLAALAPPSFFFFFFFFCALPAAAASIMPVDTSQYSLRLVGGTSPLEGRIEVRPHEGAEWGTLCSNEFKKNNFGANAVCRSLGFDGTTASVFASFGAGPAAMPIWLNSSCAADAVYFQNCASNTPESGKCAHADDSGVRCVPPVSAWEWQLANGTADLPTRGLVLFRPSPIVPWGTVSADNYEAFADPPLHMRRALCAAMGHSVDYPIVAPALRYGSADPSAPTYLHSPPNACGGHHQRVPPSNTEVLQPVVSPFSSCAMTGYFGQQKWNTSRQLQLYCDEREVHVLYQVRLVNGYAAHSGQVQYRPDDASPWMFLSNRSLLLGSSAESIADEGLHNTAALNAICRSGGFTDVTKAAFRFYGARAFGGGGATTVVQQRAQVQRIVCPMDSTATLRECDMTRSNFKMNDQTPAGVDCYPERLQGLPWEFQLVNTSVGGRASLGVVQMRVGSPLAGGFETPWGFVSANETNNFGLWDAVCAALGYSDTSTRIVRDLTRWNGGDPSWVLNTSTAFMPSFLSDVACPP